MGIAPLRLLPQTSLLRYPKISAAYALKFLTAAPYPARFFRHWRRFAGYAHQGEVPDKAVQNEFRTIPSKRSWGSSTGQRLPPRREAISHDRSHRRAVIASRKRDRIRKNGASRTPRAPRPTPQTPSKGAFGRILSARLPRTLYGRAGL